MMSLDFRRFMPPCSMPGWVFRTCNPSGGRSSRYRFCEVNLSQKYKAKRGMASSHLQYRTGCTQRDDWNHLRILILQR